MCGIDGNCCVDVVVEVVVGMDEDCGVDVFGMCVDGVCVDGIWLVVKSVMVVPGEVGRCVLD